MKLSQALVFLAYSAGKALFSGITLKCDTINNWIISNGNQDNLGRGYSGEKLRNQSSNGYVDVHRGRSRDGKILVTASVIFDARQGPTLTQSWEANKLDGRLKKKFGDNLRFRVSI